MTISPVRERTADMAEIGFGIIGCGVIADFHANALAALAGRARLVGVCDAVPESAQRFASRHGTRVFASEAEMLSCPEVEAVCICTPSGFHSASVIAAAKAGRHIVCEKPLAINKRQLDEVCEVCRESGVCVSVISQNRYADSIKRVKKAVDEGLLGKLVCADIYMKYHRSQEYYDSGAWRGTLAIDGGGALMNQGIHGVDLLLYLAGGIKSVYAVAKTRSRRIEVEDVLSAVVEYENGATGVIQATTAVFPGYPRRLELNGDRGTIILNETSIVRWDLETAANEEDIVLMPAFQSGSSTPTAISNDGHIRQLADFAECIRTGASPLSGLADGRRAVDVILAIYESARRGEKVEL